MRGRVEMNDGELDAEELEKIEAFLKSASARVSYLLARCVFRRTGGLPPQLGNRKDLLKLMKEDEVRIPFSAEIVREQLGDLFDSSQTWSLPDEGFDVEDAAVMTTKGSRP